MTLPFMDKVFRAQLEYPDAGRFATRPSRIAPEVSINDDSGATALTVRFKIHPCGREPGRNRLLRWFSHSWSYPCLAVGIHSLTGASFYVCLNLHRMYLLFIYG